MIIKFSYPYLDKNGYRKEYFSFDVKKEDVHFLYSPNPFNYAVDAMKVKIMSIVVEKTKYEHEFTEFFQLLDKTADIIYECIKNFLLDPNSNDNGNNVFVEITEDIFKVFRNIMGEINEQIKIA